MFSKVIIRRGLNKELTSVMKQSKSMNAIQFRFLSTVQQEQRAVPNYIPPTQATKTENYHSLKHIHAEYFAPKAEFKEVRDLLDARTGTFVPFTKSEIETLMPEGLSGEYYQVTKKFKETSWMVRDSTKLVLGILDEKLKTLNNTLTKKDDSATIGQNTNSISLHSKVEYPVLTSKPDWESTDIKLSYYGKELLDYSSFRNNESSELEVSNGPVSLFNQFKSQVPEIPNKLLISGERGSGKSVVLNQAILQARKSGWLTFYVPQGWDQVQSGEYIEPMSFISNKKVYDNKVMTLRVLRQFHAAHKDVLKQIPIRRTAALKKYQDFIKNLLVHFERVRNATGGKKSKLKFLELRKQVLEALSEGESYEKPDEANMTAEDLERGYDVELLENFSLEDFKLQTLEDYLLLSLALQSTAGMIFLDLINELRIVDEVPVLFAVDQYNTWDVPSVYKYDNQPVMGRQLCVPSALEFITKHRKTTEEWTIKNGFCIAVTSATHTEAKFLDYEDVKSSVPLRLRVPNFNKVEYLAYVSHLAEINKLSKVTSLQDVLALRTFTNSNPHLLFKEMAHFLNPKNVEKDKESFDRAALSYYSNKLVGLEVDNPDKFTELLEQGDKDPNIIKFREKLRLKANRFNKFSRFNTFMKTRKPRADAPAEAAAAAPATETAPVATTEVTPVVTPDKTN